MDANHDIVRPMRPLDDGLISTEETTGRDSALRTWIDHVHALDTSHRFHPIEEDAHHSDRRESMTESLDGA